MIQITRATEDSILYKDRRGGNEYSLTRRLELWPDFKECEIKIRERDTLEVAVDMLVKDSKDSVCIMNMANAFHQGGGWLEGTSAQEEQLFYRTTLAPTMKIQYYPLPDVYPMPGEPNIEEVLEGYWIDGMEPTDEVGVVFSPEVAVMREGPPDYLCYDLTSDREPEIFSVVSVAALDLRRFLAAGEPVTEFPLREHRDIMKDKIRMVLRVCALNKQYRLVLGALGCGVFKNPPHEVAAIFEEVFDEQEFSGWFREVVFAILPDKNDQNVPSFKERLGGKSINLKI